MKKLLVLGSIGIDKIITEKESRDNLLGGSASFAALSASYLAKTFLVSVVGEDFPQMHLNFLKEKKIELDSLEIIKGGKTFRWTGKYSKNMNERETLAVELNTLENFSPKLSPKTSKCNIILLANCSPQMQIQTLAQCENPEFVIADTMDLWINIVRSQVDELISKIDLLVLNDSEAKLLTQNDNLLLAAKIILKKGLKFLVIKKGEHGALIFGRKEKDFLSLCSFPIQEVPDPTGAGDSFVGGLAAFLVNSSKINFKEICRGAVYGTVLASFNCESFSMDSLANLTSKKIKKRIKKFTKFTTAPKIK